MSWNRVITRVGRLDLRKGVAAAHYGKCLVNPTLVITQGDEPIKTVTYTDEGPIPVDTIVQQLRDFNAQVHQNEHLLKCTHNSYEQYVKKTVISLYNKSPPFSMEHAYAAAYVRHIERIDEVIEALKVHKSWCNRLITDVQKPEIKQDGGMMQKLEQKVKSSTFYCDVTNPYVLVTIYIVGVLGSVGLCISNGRWV
tara:strand:+ start:1784 stop:2371 length:588 start_codon:yes stop_codon:yes gene_type:complete